MTTRVRLLEPLAIVMDALWYFAVASALVALVVEEAGPSLWALLAAAAGGFYLSRLLGRLELSPESLPIGGSILFIVGLYAILRLEYLGDLRLWELSWLTEFAAHPSSAQGTLILGSLLTVGLALRWALRGQTPLTFDSALSSFSLGFVALVLAALVDIAGDLESAVSRAALPFFALGLITIAAFHLEHTRPEASTPLDRPWALALAATVGLLLALSLLATVSLLAILVGLAWIVGGVNPEPFLLPIGQGLAWFLDRLLLALLIPIFLAVQGIAWLLSQVVGDIDFQMPEPLVPPESAEQGEEENGGRLALPLLMLARVAAGVLLTALVGAVALAIFGRLWRQRPEGTVGRERVSPEGSLMEDLGDLLGRLLSPRRQRRLTPDLPPDVMAVRRLYLDVLRQAAADGLERPPAKTPLEFASPLAQHFRSQVPGEVSRAFARARYGLKVPPPEELGRLRREWREAGK